MDSNNTNITSSNDFRLVSEVMDPEQLKRIEAVHRGFLYQHLYAVACLLNLGEWEEGTVSVEWDEDIEVSTAHKIYYIQVKTRSHPLIKSDINSALKRFEELRKHLAQGNAEKAHQFVIVSNENPGPQLSEYYASEDWPQDISIISPTDSSSKSKVLPPAWKNIDHAVKWCIEAAGKIPYSALLPETLVWKLAARIQFAATGQDLDRKDHLFSREALPNLFEQLVEQLHRFPAVPDDFIPQKDEPPLVSEAAVRLIVGFSGAGKTVWASWQARHCSAPVAYFDVGDLPGNALAGSLARELAARFLGSGTTGAAQLPAAAGIELLRALDNRINLPEPPIVVLDNIHRMNAEDMRRIVDACQRVRFILLAQPWTGKTQLEALLSIQSEELRGWDEDTIALVFANAGATISPMASSRWRSITAGMPLFVKNAALLSVNLTDGDAAGFVEQVERGIHSEELAQEALLRLIIENLSVDEAAITAALSLSTVPLSTDEVDAFLEALPTPMRKQSPVMHSLQRKGIVQVYANGYRKIHDAIRLAANDLVLRFSADEVMALHIRLRDILFKSLPDLTRFGAWMRLLPKTGKVEILVDIATTEIFHEFGEPHDLKQILVSVANAEETDPSLRFWTLDALAFWQFQMSEPKRLPEDELCRMEKLVATGDLGNREKSALIMKQMLNAGILYDKRALNDAFYRAYQRLFHDSC